MHCWALLLWQQFLAAVVQEVSPLRVQGRDEEEEKEEEEEAKDEEEEEEEGGGRGGEG